MSTSHAGLFAQLAKKFKPAEERTLAKGRTQFTYVTARTVANRLDEILGPENWWDEYSLLMADSVLCRLTIRLPDGSTLSKQDAGGAANMADAGDDDKSMVSDAFKRAATKFGVGRYLYRDGVAPFVVEELTRRKEERRAAAEQPPPPPAQAAAHVRPPNDREPVKFKADRIGPRGLDVRAWARLYDEETANANATIAAAREGLGLDADRQPISVYQVTRHMLRVGVERGMFPDPEARDGAGRASAPLKPAKVVAYLDRMYPTAPADDDQAELRRWFRRELRDYLGRLVREAAQEADNEARGDAPGPGEDAGQEPPAAAEDEAQLEPAGVGDEAAWPAGRE